jgi:hypothetical protein
VNTEKTIRPVKEWAAMIQGTPLFKQRLDDNFVERNEEYANEALSALGEALSEDSRGIIHSL